MKRHRWATVLILIIVFLSHLPFLDADPDTGISFSRGPFTDEGLNSIQIRNLVDHGYLDLTECDNLLKTPLFNLLLLAPYHFFGTSLATGRLTVLALVFTLMLVAVVRMNQKTGLMVLIFSIVSLLQYKVHQFSHFALAEMPSSVLIVFSLLVYYSSRLRDDPVKRRNRLILATSLISLSYFLKVQFIYVVPLLPLSLLLERWLFRSPWPRVLKDLKTTSLTAAIILFIYILAWYLPNFADYNHMLIHQSGTFGISDDSLSHLRHNLSNFFLSGSSLALMVLFLASLASGLFLVRGRPSGTFRILFPAVLVWNIIEMHKLIMVYLPTRYQVSILVSFGLMAALVLTELVSGTITKKPLADKALRATVILVIILVGINNLTCYKDAFEGRTYEIAGANDYLSRHTGNGDLVIGAWAPALTWESNSRAFPVWYGFLNYINPVETYKPRVVVSEPDEIDSEQAYIKQGIDLASLSDSVKIYRIGEWDVGIYWIKDTP